MVRERHFSYTRCSKGGYGCDVANRVETAQVPGDAGRAAALELIAEYEADHGSLPAESRRRARQFMLEVVEPEDQPAD
jgi:hypothetical protein